MKSLCQSIPSASSPVRRTAGGHSGTVHSNGGFSAALWASAAVLGGCTTMEASGPAGSAISASWGASAGACCSPTPDNGSGALLRGILLGLPRGSILLVLGAAADSRFLATLVAGSRPRDGAADASAGTTDCWLRS